MKLHKQRPVKVAVLALSAGAFAVLMVLVKANPQTSAETEAPAATPPASATPDYGSFFGANRAPAQPTPSVQATPAQTAPQAATRPHTRTRAS